MAPFVSSVLYAENTTAKVSRAAHTREAPRIAFLGAFDTVKFVRDNGFYDIGLLPNIDRVRHALALFEDRKYMNPQFFHDKQHPRAPDEKPADWQEAWFAGTHGNIGGACPSDGLSLWPVQWMVSEARKSGLVVYFKPIRQHDIADPTQYIFPRGAKNGTVQLQNGIQVQLWSLSGPFSEDDFSPMVYKTLQAAPIESNYWFPHIRAMWKAGRKVFQGENLLGCAKGALSVQSYLLSRVH